MFAQGGFDVVIGNPPYVQLQSMGTMSDILKAQNYQTFEKSGDIYVLFYELANRLLRENGLLGYITSKKWMKVKYGQSLRKFLAEETSLLQLIDLGNSIFKDATVDSNILIFKSKQADKHNCLSLDISNEKEVVSLDNYLDRFVRISDFSDTAWTISSPLEQAIKKKVEEVGIPLEDWNIKMNRGVLTGLNDAFIIDNEVRNELIKRDVKNQELIKPLLKGRDVKRYTYEFSDKWLIGTFPALNLDINDYPIIKNHLESFGKRLEQSGEKGCRKKTSNKWFETQDQISYYANFEKEKLVFAELSDNSTFYYDDNKYYTDKTLFFIIGEDLKYLITFLNSQLIHWYYEMIAASSGVGTTMWQKQNIVKLPIPKVLKELQKPFIEKGETMQSLNKSFQSKKTKFLKRVKDNFDLDKLSKKLEAFYEHDFKTFLAELKKKKVTLTLKEQDEWEEYFESYQKELLELKANIDATDKQIDSMVYALYGLSDDEVAVVEGA